MMNDRQRIRDAIQAGDLDRMRALIEADPDLVHAMNDDSPWPTPLHLAAANGQTEIVELLIAHGADIRWRGPQTPLHVAWQRVDNVDVIRILVANGAAPSPLLAAVYLNNVAEIESLLRADPGSIHVRDDVGMTPLHRAAENGQAEVVKCLLAHGADVEARTNDGQTVLQRSYYHKHILAILLAHGAYLDIITAVNLGRTESVVPLLQSDPSLVNARIWDQTPLQFAARGGQVELVERLLDYGADVDANGGWKRWTPLHWAAHDGRTQIVGLLLARGANAHAKDEDGKTPLDIALEKEHAKVADLLRGGASESSA
jgi:ankyrin repeat protein